MVGPGRWWAAGPPSLLGEGGGRAAVRVGSRGVLLRVPGSSAAGAGSSCSALAWVGCAVSGSVVSPSGGDRAVVVVCGWSSAEARLRPVDVGRAGPAVPRAVRTGRCGGVPGRAGPEVAWGWEASAGTRNVCAASSRVRPGIGVGSGGGDAPRGVHAAGWADGGAIGLRSGVFPRQRGYDGQGFGAPCWSNPQCCVSGAWAEAFAGGRERSSLVGADWGMRDRSMGVPSRFVGP